MTRLRSLVAAGLSIFGLVASSGIASAHAQYQSSNPAANATEKALPSAVQVTWTQELASIQFTITGPDGSNAVNGAAQIDLAQRHNASVPVRDAGPGLYLVVWHNVSGDDGDPNDGSFAFTVAGTPPTSPAATPLPAAGSNSPTPPPAAAQSVSNTPVCIDNGQITPGQADFRVNTYCKRQMIRTQYKGKIDELVFNYDLSIGMGLENSLKDAMRGNG